MINSTVTISPRITAIVLESLRFAFSSHSLCGICHNPSPPRLYRTYFPNVYSVLLYDTTPCSKMEEFFEHLFCLFCKIYSKIFKICFIPVLCSKARICQITFFNIPLFQSTIIKHLQIIFNNEWNNIIFQAFFKHNQSAYATVSILKWMNPFKFYMKFQNIFKCLSFYRYIPSKRFHFSETSSGLAVSIPPTSFGNFYSPQP